MLVVLFFVLLSVLVVFFLPLIFIKTSVVKWLVVEKGDSVLCRVLTQPESN